VLIAITTEGKLGLGILAGLFIAFAILSAFYFPRRNPDFPGDRLGLFTLVTVVLFIGTIAGVVVFASEEEEHGVEAAATGTETGEGETQTTAEQPKGDPAAGEKIFASAGCGDCHTLEAAGSSGNVGPNLDDAKPDAALVVELVTDGKPPMPSFDGQLDEQQIQDVAAFVVASTHG
jgi:cytochrome c553